MKAGQFNELCEREYAQDKGDVVRLHLTRESYMELLADILRDPVELDTGGETPAGNVAAGARLDAMANPATCTVVKVALAGAFAPGTAEVERRGQVTTVELAASPA